MSPSTFYLLFSILLGGVLVGITLLMMSMYKFKSSERRIAKHSTREEKILLAKINARLKRDQVKSMVREQDRYQVEHNWSS